MKSHVWIAGVLEDLLTYSEQHDLKEMRSVLSSAVAAAAGLVRSNTADPKARQFDTARV